MSVHPATRQCLVGLVFCTGISGCQTLSPIALRDVQPGAPVRIRFGAAYGEVYVAETTDGTVYDLDANQLTLSRTPSGDTTDYFRLRTSLLTKMDIFEGHSRADGSRKGAVAGLLATTAVLLTTFRACPPGPTGWFEIQWCGGTTMTLWKGGIIGSTLGALVGVIKGSDRWRPVMLTKPLTADR